MNVVIMEAKRANAGSQGVSQALAYMGKYLTILSQCNLGLTYKKGVSIGSARHHCLRYLLGFPNLHIHEARQ